MIVRDRMPTKQALFCHVGAWTAAASVLAVSSPALAEKQEDKDLGSEFVDMPEGWEPPAPPEEKDAPKGDEREVPGYLPGYSRHPSVGLSPHAPVMHSALPGGVAPSFGSLQPEGREWQFQFTGYLQGGFRASIGRRDSDTAYEGQRLTTLHGDALVPGGSWGWFDHTMTVPGPWTHLLFSYGNESVQAHAMLGSWSVAETMVASGYYQMVAQNWFTQAYLSYTPRIEDIEPVATKFLAGVYSDRYGAMAKYSEGAYGGSVVGRIGGMGTTGTVSLPFEGDIDVNVEGGFKGDMNKAPVGIGLNPAYEHPQPNEGSTYAAHGHVGLTYDQTFSPTLHYIHSWSQDDRQDPYDDPLTPTNESATRRDGSVDIIGADVRVDGKRFGYFYFGGSRLRGENASTVSNLVAVLNSGGGKETSEEYWGYASEGNGTLTFLGTQYTLSLGTLLRYPDEFWGEGPDLIVSLFGIMGRANSRANEFDKTLFKYGTEVTYSMLPWLATSIRFDHVMPELDQSRRQFAVVSPKLVFRTDWNTREALTLQYAGYFLGSDVTIQGDNRLLNAPSGKPDKHLLTLFGTIWW